MPERTPQDRLRALRHDPPSVQPNPSHYKSLEPHLRDLQRQGVINGTFEYVDGFNKNTLVILLAPRPGETFPDAEYIREQFQNLLATFPPDRMPEERTLYRLGRLRYAERPDSMDRAEREESDSGFFVLPEATYVDTFKGGRPSRTTRLRLMPSVLYAMIMKRYHDLKATGAVSQDDSFEAASVTVPESFFDDPTSFFLGLTQRLEMLQRIQAGEPLGRERFADELREIERELGIEDDDSESE